MHYDEEDTALIVPGTSPEEDSLNSLSASLPARSFQGVVPSFFGFRTEVRELKSQMQEGVTKEGKAGASFGRFSIRNDRSRNV